ncbi:MAG: putative membrane protein, partial [Parvibaculaceae bacterium]
MQDDDVSSGSQQFINMSRSHGLDLISPRTLLLTIATVLVCFLGLSYTSPAQADYRFCNHTSYVLSSSIAFEKDGEWKSQGWYR